ncbi:hypothetical protein FQN60_018766, partial [Etheostoma spectabile]
MTPVTSTTALILTVMRPGPRYLLGCQLSPSLKMRFSHQIISILTQCLLPSLLKELLKWTISRTYLKHFASCLG